MDKINTWLSNLSN